VDVVKLQWGKQSLKNRDQVTPVQSVDYNTYKEWYMAIMNNIPTSSPIWLCGDSLVMSRLIQLNKWYNGIHSSGTGTFSLSGSITMSLYHCHSYE